MKAMRDERGEMVRNAHLLGFFRRICKLLFLRAKPVFVFDGGTPALKRRTVAARRRHRENARAKIRKTAEKLLLNHLKSKRLEELAEELKTGKSSAMVDLNGKQAASVNDENPDFGKSKSINQESLDELLAASIAAEEEGKLGGNEPVLTEDFNYQEEEEDEDEEDDDNVMIFPVNSGDIDPAVLASLPPSLQLDLLDQMREKLMAENRQKYQKIKKVPAKFSELQIQSYLKTVAFRREINEVQKCASGRGVGGLQTSRIASEANREYIFSSSFTGDKKKLTPTGTEKNGGMVNHEMRMPAASDESKRKLFASPSKPSVDTSSDAVTRDYTPDVETYLDDRGRVRVSRVRGLGIRMTRDLQRNLDLMKEYDQVLVKKDLNKIPEPISDNAASSNGNSQTNDTPSLSLVNEESSYCNSISLASNGLFEKISRDTGKSTTIPVNEAAIEISFSEDESGSKTMVDCFFMNLISENTAARLFSESIPLEKNVDDVESECIWEDGVVGEQSSSLKRNEIQLSFAESKGCEEDDVEWEEGTSLVPHSVDSVEALSRGLLEEEADLKEAIRRSLEDNKSMQSLSAVPVGEDTRTIFKDQNSLISVKNDLNIDVQVPRAQIIDSHNEHLHTSTVLECRFEGESILEDGKKTLSVCNSVGLSPDIQPMEQCNNLSLQNDQFNIASNQMVHEPNLGKTDDHALKSYTKTDFEPCCNKFDFGHGDALNDYVAIQPNHTSEIRSSICSSSGETLGAGVSKTSLTEKREACNEGMEELANKDTCKDPVEALSFKDQASILEEDKIAASDADLHDEISLLKQEREYLGIEQRKLERNAESVSSEMFAECQELLQMFGLPYIIAPMEAEAQCAYMEMTNFVDGIVTDDSDVFLFGARNVFKNIFDDRKYVETYFMKDIENELGLSRDKLIRTALLLGSDYTEGVSGIGIVNAIEVINAFSEKDGLLKFKNWVESPDPSIFGLCGSKHGGNLSKRSSITNGNAADGMETNIDCSKESDLGGDQSSDNDIHDDKVKEVFMDKHRNVSKNWHFPPSFPSESVVTAYIYPQIDESTEPFTWGKPDLPLLRKMCWEKFGWPIQKADELLVPVLKEYNKHETQLRMEAFYSFNERFAKIRSQRIKKAVKGIVGTCSSGLTDIADGESSSKKKKRTTLSNNEQSQLENDTDRSATTKKKPSKKSGKATESQSSLSHGSSKQCGENVKREQMINTRVKGRGRGKRKQDEHSNEEFTESTSIDESSTSKTQRSTMPPEFLPEMRRSTRHRKQVNYAEDDAEINELHVPDKSTQEDNMHSGGGFCLEGNELHDKQSRPVTIPMAHSFQLNDGNRQLPSGDGNSSSCLFTGGGFCIDESDPSMPDAAERFQEKLDDTSYQGISQAADEDLHVLEGLGRDLDKVDDCSAKNFLSAMPSLKRKRRKG